MKIAMMFTQLEVGGAQTRTFQTASELRRLGHEVDVYCIYKARDCFEDEAITILANGKKPSDIPIAIKNLFISLRRHKYDCFISNTAPANILGNPIALLCGISPRFGWQTQPPQRLGRVVQMLDHIWGVLGIYTRSVANSKWTRSCFQDRSKRYQNRMITIVNGIEPRLSPHTREDARAKLGIGKYAKVVLTVGRLSEQKGQETLINAIAMVPEATLYIVGDGEKRQELSDKIGKLELQDRVTLVGEVDGAVVADYFRAADLFAFPSRWETFGLAAIEAAASGLPIVSTDLDVLGEVLKLPDGRQSALFVPVDDPEAMAQAVSRVLSDDCLLAELKNKSLEIGRVHSLEKHVSSILDTIRTFKG